jgi:uncharacterized protein YunC (DUF1805 family)
VFGVHTAMETREIPLGKGKALGILVEMGASPLVIVKASGAYVMCGYLNMTAANKLGDVAGRVTGVRTFDDVLAAEVVEVSEEAKRRGAVVGVTGREFLIHFARP